MIRRFLPIAALILLGGSVALAQQAPVPASELMLSWRSNGFAPGGYAGRVAATGGGAVLLTAEALIGGRPADLSKYEVRWYVNDELYESGFGKQSVSVYVDAFHQDSIDVRVEIINAPFTTTLASISVPLTDPIAVIEQRSGRYLAEGENAFAANAYSFSVTNPNDLIYNWTVNGDVPQTAENPRELVVSFDGPPEASTDIELVISHPQNEEEAAATSIRMHPASR